MRDPETDWQRGAEDFRIRWLQRLVESVVSQFQAQPPEPAEGARLIAQLRAQAERLFPDKGPTFDLIYLPRLLRAASLPATVLADSVSEQSVADSV